MAYALIVKNGESWYNQYDPGRFLLEERQVEFWNWFMTHNLNKTIIWKEKLDMLSNTIYIILWSFIV